MEGPVIHVEYAVPVHASRASAWRLLCQKVESPGRYLQSVVECEVTERREDSILRRVSFDDGNAVTERVVLIPEEEIIFHLLDHPKFDGEIRNILFQPNETLWLAYYFRGSTRRGIELGPDDFEQLRLGFAQAVSHAARQIEEEESEEATIEAA